MKAILLALLVLCCCPTLRGNSCCREQIQCFGFIPGCLCTASCTVEAP